MCAVKGYRFAPVSSDAFAKEKLDTMRAFGADLHIVASDGGKITPGLFDRMRAEVTRMCEDPDTYWTDQFHNEDAIRGYMGIDDGRAGRRRAARSSAAPWHRGDARASAGAESRRLRGADQCSSRCRPDADARARRNVHVVDRAAAPPHLKAGVTTRRAVDDRGARCRRGARKARHHSSALNVVAALKLARELGPGVVATVAVDSGLNISPAICFLATTSQPISQPIRRYPSSRAVATIVVARDVEA